MDESLAHGFHDILLLVFTFKKCMHHEFKGHNCFARIVQECSLFSKCSVYSFNFRGFNIHNFIILLQIEVKYGALSWSHWAQSVSINTIANGISQNMSKFI